MNIETPTQTIKPNTLTTQNKASTSAAAEAEAKPFKAELEDLKFVSGKTETPENTAEKPAKFVSGKTETPENTAEKSAKFVSDKQPTTLKPQLAEPPLGKIQKQNITQDTAQKTAVASQNISVQVNKTVVTKDKKTTENKKFIESKLDGKKNVSEIIVQNEINTLEEIVSQKVLSTSKVSEKATFKKETAAEIKNMDYTQNVVKMDDNDAQFFANLVQDGEFSIETVAGDVAQLKDVSDASGVQKSVQVSATLMNSLSEAVKTNQPLRIDFDKDISVIIKVDKQGKISAEFIPGDAAVENYLRNNVPILKQRFDEQGLNYNELSYRQRQQNQRNNKENKDE